MNDETLKEQDEARPETVPGRSRYPLLSDVADLMNQARCKLVEHNNNNPDSATGVYYLAQCIADINSAINYLDQYNRQINYEKNKNDD